MKKAVIYCRVSSDRQAKNDTIASQEYECRRYAKRNNLEIVEVFKDLAISGSTLNRESVQNLIVYLTKHKNAGLIVIVDKLDRFARDSGVWSSLIKDFKELGGEIHTLSRVLDYSPESNYMNNIEVAQAQYFRESLIIKTKARMRAHMEMGFYLHNPPMGFKRTRDSENKVYCSRKEPEASIIQIALEKFSTGELRRRVDVKRFLENNHNFSKNKISNDTIDNILTNPIYTGYFAYPQWGIKCQKWKMDKIISRETYEAVQNRLKNGKREANRKNINKDFPLSRYVSCSYCGKLLNYNPSKSKTGKIHLHYLCRNKDCVMKNKSIRKADIEEKFENEVLKLINTDKYTLNLANAIVQDCIKTQKKTDEEKIKNINKQIAAKNIGIQNLVERITKSQKRT